MDQTLHLPTIMIVHALITLISTVVTIYMWLRNRDSRILPLLVAAGLAACAAMLLHSARSTLPLFVSSGLGLGLGVLAVGIYWQAVVAFEGGEVSLTKASLGIMLWAALWLTPVFHQSMAARTTILGLLVAGYCFLTAREIMRSDLPTVSADVPVTAAEQRIVAEGLEAVLVVDSDGQLCGILPRPRKR